MTNENKRKTGSDRRQMSETGRKDRQMSQGRESRPDNPSAGQQSGGNYASDRQQMADPSHKGGEHSGGGRS